MSVAPPLPLPRESAPPAAAARRGGVYLRQYRAQPRSGARSRVLVLLLLALGLMFLRVWERTQANALAMERDGLAREVRALENRIQLSTDLADQAALREGLSMDLLEARGFESPDPSRIVEIDPALVAVPETSRPAGVGAAIARALRRIAPPKKLGNGAEMPAAIHAGVAR